MMTESRRVDGVFWVAAMISARTFLGVVKGDPGVIGLDIAIAHQPGKPAATNGDRGLLEDRPAPCMLIAKRRLVSMPLTPATEADLSASARLT